MWKGLFFSECEDVEISRTYFENISPYPVDSTYAAEFIDCEYVDINYSRFRAELDIKTGGVLINYTSQLRAKEVYVNYNYFEMDAGEMPALTVITSGYITFPMIIEGNEFVGNSGNSLNALLLSGIEGGAIKNNQFTGYKNGIILIWAMMDLYGNYIEGSYDDSKGILSYASSSANLAPDGLLHTGGSNSISCEGEYAKCIDVDYSFLYLNEGYNIFDLRNYQSGNSFHLSGTISDEAYADPLEATLNCFQLSETETDAVHNMTWTNEDPINYNFLAYYCNDKPEGGMIAMDLGNGMYDTIYTESSGSGGGVPSEKSRRKNEKFIQKQLVDLTFIESLNDSISINIRKRSYERVSELCYELLTDYIDSLGNAGLITKLYLAELKLDSNGNRVSGLKSFLETLILNNPEKESFVRQSFYIIQKCKVYLELYESAMTGFQEIINQNPYNYEGLIASWDYAATSLLDSLGGSGGVIANNYELEITDYGLGSVELQNDNEYFADDPGDKYDSKKFTKENRKTIRQTVIKSFINNREKEIHRVNKLEDKVKEGKSTKEEKMN